MSSGRRLYLYTTALLGYMALLAALVLFSRELLPGDVPFSTGLAASARDAATPWLLLAGVAAIVWSSHWLLANRSARELTMAAATERASAVRKAYLYLGQGWALALVVAQAWIAVADAIVEVLSLPDATPAQESVPLAALLTGAAIALVLWGYLRWETVRDDDFGRERGRAANWRRAYVYLAALAGSVLAIAGAGESIRRLLLVLTRSSARGAGWQVILANALAALIVGAPLAIAAWRTADRLARQSPAVEMNALSRVTLRYGGLALGTVVTLISVSYVLAQVLLFALGLLIDSHWQPFLAYLPAGLITWLVCAAGIRHDVGMGGECARTAAFRRMVRYAVAGLALTAFWLGLIEFVRLILLALLRVHPSDPAVAVAWWTRFAYAAALVFVGAPAWWGHWWTQQVRAHTTGKAGPAERASAIRRVYLLAVTLAGATVALAALGFTAFLLLNQEEAGIMGTRAALAGAGATAAVSVFWTIAHALTLRGDRRWQVADIHAQTASREEQLETPDRNTLRQTMTSTVRSPLTYPRNSLPTLDATLQGAQTTISRPPSGIASAVVVIDGADGTVGAAALAALRRTLPDVVLWPVGLNATAQVSMLTALDAALPPAVPGDALARAVAILGPCDILLPGSLDGEVTNEWVVALAASPARVLLLPPRAPRLRWVAAPHWPLERWIDNAVIEIADLTRTA